MSRLQAAAGICLFFCTLNAVSLTLKLSRGDLWEAGHPTIGVAVWGWLVWALHTTRKEL